MGNRANTWLPHPSFNEAALVGFETSLNQMWLSMVVQLKKIVVETQTFSMTFLLCRMQEYKRRER